MTASAPLDRGVFLLSLDTELAWGGVHDGGHRSRAESFRHTRSAVSRLLELMATHGIRATWAFVGHLMLRACGRDGGRKHPEIVRPDYEWFEGDWFADDPASDWRRAPDWYAPDLLEAVLDCPAEMEIGCHTFSHVVVGDEGCSRRAFASELAACRSAAEAWGLELRSFVHPRDEIGHLGTLAEHGFTCYRGAPFPAWEHSVPEPVGKLTRGVRWTTSMPPLTARPSRRRGLWNLPATSFYLHRSGAAGAIPVSLRVRRAEVGIERAIEENSLFHLYFHPFNLASDPDGLLGGLDRLFRHVSRRRAEGKLANPTMGSLAERLERSDSGGSEIDKTA